MVESDDLSENEHSVRPEPEQYRLHPGQWIGECQILAPIGRGGMGEVYRVRHRSLGKELALKSLAVNDYVLKKRFVAEAKALAKLEHANIVKIYDFFEDQYGHLCYLMELVEGLSFSRYLRQRRPLNERFAAFLFRQVFSALDYSHSRGIIHRDIKPSNIMVVKPNSNAPVMRVVDFGLAKLQRDLSMQGLTMEGDVIGSPLYMSPEQCLGQEVDLRSDLYSAGCSLFQALTGTVPFDGDAMSSINLKTSEPAPFMCELALDIVISEGMEDLVASLLAIDPDERVQTAAEVCKILYAIECGLPPPVGSLRAARPSAYRRRSLSNKSNKSSKSSKSGRSGYEEHSSASHSSLSVSAGTGVRRQMTMAFMVLAALFICLSIVGVTAFALIGSRHGGGSRGADQVKPWAVYSQDDRGRVLNVDLTSPALVRYKQLGNLVLTSAEHYRSFPLLGKFSMPLNAPVMLQIDSDLAYHPELMRGLPSDLLAVIDSVDGVSFSDASVAEIPHFGTLRDLRLAGSGLTDKCLPDLERLLFVQEFSLSSRHISASALAKVRFLPNLRSIKLRYIQNIDVLLDTLAACEDLTSIQLDDVVITDATMKKICKLKSLHNLELRRMDLNHDLSALKELPNLRVIDFSESTMSNKCLAQIAELKHLERFRMGQSYLTTADVAWLKAQLPGVRVDVRPLMSVEKFDNGK